MRLLILTQTIDRKDSTLGFFTVWVAELAKRISKITVFALRVGNYELPENVTVVPIRPWDHRARIRTALRVLHLSWQYRKDYDVVFVHMNQEYVLIAGWLWKILGKKIYLWRNHYGGTFLTDIAALFCTKVFYTSKSSYTAKYAQSMQMPVGVDVDSCHLEEPIERTPRSILFLGRFSPSKHPDVLVEALGILFKKGISVTATFAGGADDYAPLFPEQVATRARELGIGAYVSFVGAVPNTETYRYYRSHAMYMNGGKSGMLDKSLFKSIACGCLPIFASKDLEEIIGPDFFYQHGNAPELADRIEKALSLSEEERSVRVREYQSKAVEAHALPLLIHKLVSVLSTP